MAKDINPNGRLQTFGFTLTEILLSIAIFVALTSLAIPIYRNVQIRSDLNLAEDQVKHALSRAQLLSQTSTNAAKWGYHVPSGTMYKTGVKAEGQTNYSPNDGLRKNTSIAFDVGFVLNGYCSDWGRSFYYGNPEDHIKTAYTELMASVVDVTDEIMGEVQRTDQVFPYIEEQIGKTGLGDYLEARHPQREVGHQIGVELHETPWLRPEDRVEIQDGMVFCIEPKLWNNGYYNIRVEDMILIKNGNAESLTTYDRELFQI